MKTTNTNTKNKTLTLYRVEDKRGRGPYSSCDYQRWTDKNRDHSAPKHPGPDKDPDLKDLWRNEPWGSRHQFYFGFISLKSLRTWFSTTERRRLKKRGYRVVKVNVPEKHILKGRKQVAFKKNVVSKKQVLKTF